MGPYRFFEATIQSHGRLTYSAVAEYLSSGRPISDLSTVRESISHLHAICLARRRRRQERGALEFSFPEMKVKLADGFPVDSTPLTQNMAHFMVEEAMICANIAAAKFIQGGEGVPLFRVHDPPSPADVAELRAALKPIGVDVPANIDDPRALSGAMRLLRRTNSSTGAWELLVLRSLQKAEYSPRAVGHYGLALLNYTHFTSPIRRYCDLYVHRLVKGQLSGQLSKPGEVSTIEHLGADITRTEIRATDVERTLGQWFTGQLLRKHAKEKFKGVVVGVAEFGLFVEFSRFRAQGFIHVSNLSSEWYRVDGLRLVSTHGRDHYRYGDSLSVFIKRIDLHTGRIELSLDRAKPSARRPTARRKSRIVTRQRRSGYR